MAFPYVNLPQGIFSILFAQKSRCLLIWASPRSSQTLRREKAKASQEYVRRLNKVLSWLLNGQNKKSLAWLLQNAAEMGRWGDIWSNGFFMTRMVFLQGLKP